MMKLIWKKLIDSPNKKIIGEEYDITYWRIENNKVWHQWKKMSRADVNSFEIIDDEDFRFFGRDKDFIYHAWNKLTKVDRNTFQKADGPYWKDKNFIYFEYETSLRPLKGMDAKSFHYLDNGFAYDKNFAYYCGKYIRSCKQPTTLTVNKVDNLFAKDADNIYFESAALKNVDLESWKLLNNAYSKDRKSIYFGQYKLPKVDIETWEHIHRAYSKDKNRVYNMAWVKKGANPKDWDKEYVFEIYKKSARKNTQTKK